MEEIKLKNLIARPDMNTRILEHHPENSDFLLTRIARHKEMIANYVLKSMSIRQMAEVERI